MGNFITMILALAFSSFVIFCMLQLVFDKTKSVKEKLSFRGIVRVITPITKTVSTAVTKSLDGGKTLITTTIQKTITENKKEYFVKKSKKEIKEEEKHKKFREDIDEKNKRKIRNKYKEDFKTFDTFEYEKE